LFSILQKFSSEAPNSLSSKSPAGKSFNAHASHVDVIADSMKLKKNIEQYMNPGALDQTRHAYLLSAASDVIESFPLSSWLTIGYLRYGSDANFLKRSGAGRVENCQRFRICG
jgi:hypothetical protein